MLLERGLDFIHEVPDGQRRQMVRVTRPMFLSLYQVLGLARELRKRQNA